MLKKLRTIIIKQNIFDEDESLPVNDQILSTRIFFLLLLIALLILFIFTSIIGETVTKNIAYPSLTKYQYLEEKYSTTISCPCSNASISYNNYLSFNIKYHQICSSQFIESIWIKYLFNSNLIKYYFLDYRLSASSQFQILSILCQYIQQTLNNTIETYGTNEILTEYLLSSYIFKDETSTRIQIFQMSTNDLIQRIIDFISLNIGQNLIISGLRTNFAFIYPPNTVLFTTSSPIYHVQNDDSNCLCETIYTCYEQAGFYNYTTKYNVKSTLFYNLTGFYGGCIPQNSLFSSTLECLYNQLCLNNLKLIFSNENNQTIEIIPLNSSLNSIYTMNMNISTMINELLIESWNIQSSYSDYYQACLPSICTYSYQNQWDIIYIITTITSLFGGLIVALRILVPILIKSIRYIQKFQCIKQQISPESIPQRHFFTKIHQLIINLNLFKSTMNDNRDEILSTRYYIILLITTILILIIYYSLSVYTDTITIKNPTKLQFEQLQEKYPLTLSCPCTQLSTEYKKCLNLQARYHQICSSQFIENIWFNYFQFNLNNSKQNSFDFRGLHGQTTFRLLQTFCQTSEYIVSTSLTTFLSTKLININVLSQIDFNNQMNSLMEHFQSGLISSFLYLSNIVRYMMQDNQLVSRITDHLGLDSYSINNSLKLRFKASQYYQYSCSCALANNCIRSQGFYCSSNSHCFLSTTYPDLIIPGLVISCLPIDSLRLSNLVCFYNQSCVNQLISNRLYDSNGYSYDSFNTNITALDKSISSRFLPTTTLQSIISLLFIEDWSNSTDFDSYYNQCSVNYCTYTYTKQFSTVYVLTAIIGLWGGLTVALKILIPPFVHIIRRLFASFCRRQRIQTTNEMINPEQEEYSYNFKNLYQTIIHYNVYKGTTKKPSPHSLTDQLLGTRLYLLFFLIALIILTIFISFRQQTISVTIKSPSSDVINDLYQNYSSTLTCPCSQTSITYNTFLSLAINSHQICSSSFVSSAWWSLLYGNGNSSEVYDRILLSGHFRLLSSLCTLSKQTLMDSINALVITSYISANVIPYSLFISQMDILIKTFVIQTSNDFQLTVKLVSDLFRANQLQTIYGTNWNMLYTTQNENFILQTQPIYYNNNTCTCATTSDCTMSLVFMDQISKNLVSIEGMIGGCLPIYGLRQSTLQCLYNSTCINYFNRNILLSSLVINPLNPINQSRFSTDTLIGTLIDELFIESWTNSTNYSAYFSICAPTSCQYTYIKYYDAVYIIINLLGLYGGLTVGLKIFISYALQIFRFIKKWIDTKRNQTQVIPITA